MHEGRPLRSTRRIQNLVGAQPSWWRIENKKTTDGPTLVHIYDEIGFYGVSADGFRAELGAINGDIELHLNSPGGDVFDGIAIYNQLKQAQARGSQVRIVVDSLAASAASFIAQAASPGQLEMAPHSEMMIHEGFSMGIGNAGDFRKLAGDLERVSNNIASIYAERAGKDVGYWRDLMQEETWLSAAAAVEMGLADRIQGEDDGTAPSWDLSVYGRYGKPVTAKGAPKKTAPPKKTATPGGDKPIGDGWVMDSAGNARFDPDGDGDDDATPEGDSDHDYFDESGKQIREIPPCPSMPSATAKGTRPKGAKVDNSPWDASKAWHNGAEADDPAAFYAAICAGKRNGDPDTQDGWALPYRYTPDSPPNASGVRAALSMISQAKGLLNRDEAQSKLERLMRKINPDYEGSDNHIDPGLLAAVFGGALEGGGR